MDYEQQKTQEQITIYKNVGTRMSDRCTNTIH